MRALNKALAILIALLLLSSCAIGSQGSRGRSLVAKGDEGLLLPRFDQQAQCYNGWDRLVTAWEANGGGFKSSLKATRLQISNDGASSFARIVRGVWGAQKERSSLKFGSWPVERADIKRVVVKPNDQLAAVLDVYLPRGCGAFAELYPVIWDHVHVVANGKIHAARFSEMPASADFDSGNEPRWILYWLFARQ